MFNTSSLNVRLCIYLTESQNIKQNAVDTFVDLQITSKNNTSLVQKNIIERNATMAKYDFMTGKILKLRKRKENENFKRMSIRRHDLMVITAIYFHLIKLKLRFKPCSRCVGCMQWRELPTMVQARNKS